jgi:hypothetical protein
VNEELRIKQMGEQLREIAAAFAYPPTPDITAGVRSRLARQARPASRPRLAWAAAVLAIALIAAALLSVPQVQAFVRSIFHIGAIEVVVATPTPNPPGATAVPTATPYSVLHLPGETTLEDAQKQLTYPILLPAYPPDLGKPDKVFLQNVGGPMVVLAWLQPGHPDQARMGIYEMISSTVARKTLPDSTILQETTVHGRQALWIHGPHMLQFYNKYGQSDLEPKRLVDGNALLWDEQGITYRLETTQDLQEAVRIAESLR